MTVGVLRYTVVVRHPETGAATPLLVGDPVPDWATGLVHPDDLDSIEDESPKPTKKAAAKRPVSK